MTRLRAAKVRAWRTRSPTRTLASATTGGKLVVVGWGSTFGPIHQAVRRAMLRAWTSRHIHIRYIAPFPKNLRLSYSRASEPYSCPR